jgi:hypothetical protein
VDKTNNKKMEILVTCQKVISAMEVSAAGKGIKGGLGTVRKSSYGQ